MTSFEVEFPFVHSTGPALARFFEGLQERTIWARRCGSCGLVVVPARDYCDACGTALGEWHEVGPEGTARGTAGAFVRVRLDGAGTDLIHVATGALQNGARVRAVWASERTGTIRDIAGFEAVP